MAAIRGKNTKPEIVVRSLLHSLGFRFRLHQKNLPGKPDIVLARHRLAIFVHGFFGIVITVGTARVVPASRLEFWSVKRNGNVDRDRRNLVELKRVGWKTLVIWECETKDKALLTDLIRSLLGD